ncbi:MAG: hypothetical protein HN509_11095 [Halobacteriovoraceae bacterium]|jgi:hypothetical protein|nr:hypothetical protein [Halobacteriovoraceae bacterium]MBT5094529.1 hypothetical protein [Halobacteriovoraceae bacterium]
MQIELFQHLDRALQEYSEGDHYKTLIEAKDEYFKITGGANEEDEDYESRMSSFNDWYVLQFISRRGTRTVMRDYLEKQQPSDQVSESLLNVNHSLFEYTGTNMRKQLVLKDILHDKKVILSKDHAQPALLKNDLFLGRVLQFEGGAYLMDGKRIIPKEVRSILQKQAKKVRKLKDAKEEASYLLEVESLKTKWLRYGHIDASKIFVFS